MSEVIDEDDERDDGASRMISDQFNDPEWDGMDNLLEDSYKDSQQ